MFTGASSRRRARGAVSLASILFIFSGSSQAQSLKLVSLSVPADVVPGSWVSYRVNVEFKNRTPRRVTQRLAVVSREGSGEESGAWLELRTSETGRTRVERGFFAPAARGASGGLAPPRLTLARYQRLMPDGRLLEYPVGEEGSPLADDDISAMDLIEFGGTATSDTLAPDTLRVGRAVVPCAVQRLRRYGKHDWQGDDTTYVNHAVMAQTFWNSAMVPITGYARSVIEVFTERVPLRPPALPDTAARADSALVRDRGTTARLIEELPVSTTGGPVSFFRAEITLLDQGKDAVPEVTQVPELAPDDGGQRPRLPIR